MAYVCPNCQTIIPNNMKRNHSDDEKLMATLRELCKPLGGQRQFARAHRFSESFICQVRSGKSMISERLAEALRSKS